jgi:hypothetical protein
MKRHYNVIINCTATEISDELKEAISEIISNLEESFAIDLSCLDTVYLTDNYSEDVANHKRKDLNELKTTDTEFGVGVAIAIPERNATDVRVSVFIDLNHIIKCLHSEYGRKSIIHLMHHELCHVEDMHRKSILLCELLYVQASGPDIYLNQFAGMMWDEYYAHRQSSATMQDEDQYDLAALLNILEKITEAINDEILEYRISTDLNKVLSTSMLYIKQSLSFMARVAGNVDGSGTSLESMNTKTFRILLQSPLFETYQQTKICLENMHSNRSEWESIKEYDCLKHEINSYIIELGFVLERTQNNGLYVHIPLRPESTPDC